MIISVSDLKCRSLKLLYDRNFLFESQKSDTLLIYAYIVNHSILKIFIKNDINYVISLSRKVKLKMVINYEITKCYVINSFKYNLAAKTLKRSFN